LIDKLTILEIKLENIRDEAKIANVRFEYDYLSEVCRKAIVETEEIRALRSQLKEVNRTIWRVEDQVREHEGRKEFGPDFVELARTAYLSNDSRSIAKRRINDLLNSNLIEEKSHNY
jgi:hypothetical protein